MHIAKYPQYINCPCLRGQSVVSSISKDGILLKTIPILVTDTVFSQERLSTCRLLIDRPILCCVLIYIDYAICLNIMVKTLYYLQFLPIMLVMVKLPAILQDPKVACFLR